MPTQFSALDNSFPSFTGQESVEQKVDALYNYTFMLLENLRYVLRNLSTENFNEPDLKNFVSSITDPINATIEDTAAGLRTAIDVQAGRITLEVSKSGTGSLGEGETLFSRIAQNAEDIELRVEKNGVISSINQSAEAIVIDAAKVDLSGKVSFSDLSTPGQTTIVGDNITSGTIEGVTLVSSDGGPGALLPSDVEISDGSVNLKYGNTTYGQMTIGDAMGKIYHRTFRGYDLYWQIYGWSADAVSGNIVLDGGTVLTEGKNYGTISQRDAIAYPSPGQVFFVI